MKEVQIECVDALAHMEALCFASPWSKEEIVSEFESNPFFHAWMNESGYLFLNEAYEQAEVVRIGILPQYRKQGLAYSLLMGGMAHAKGAGCESMSLEVRVSNVSAMHLYKKCGFKKSHCSKHHYADGEDAWIMTCEL